MTISDKTRFEELKASGLLPSPRGVALAVMQLAHDENVTNAEVARTIKSDPALAGRIVKAANTAQFAGRRPVAAIPDALMVLGLSTVRQLALGFALVTEYRNGKCAHFDYDAFWSRSLITALALQAIATRTRVASPEEMFLVGLLGRIGCLALATVHPKEYAAVLEQLGDRPFVDLAAYERDAFATDHNELSAAMMADFGLPKVFAEPALFQELPASGKFTEGSRAFMLAYSMHFAGYIGDLCLAPEAARPSMLPNLFLLGSRIALDAEKVSAIADQTVRDWREWGPLLDVPAGSMPPLAEIAAQALPADNTQLPDDAPAADEMRRLRVLVVDDDPETVELLESILSEAGYEVFTAANGKDGLARAMQCRPQAIIADWIMPQPDGLQFCRALRSTQIGRGVYFVLLTALTEDSRLVEAFDNGIDDYVQKPVNPRLLLARLRAAERVIGLQNEVESDRDDVRRFAAELAMSNRRLQEAALLDPLTAIPNRRYAMDRMHQEWSAAERGSRALATMLIDVDHFKRINDTHGHDVGDTVLKRVAETLKTTARVQDVICRIGGEEFLVICPDTDSAAAAQCAERLRQAVCAARLPIGNVMLQVTISIGVAAMDQSMHGPGAMIKAADQAVYAAKQAGRNRTCVYRPRQAAASRGIAANA
jgi:diguanylate cyclase (GGDEF)-like protein